MPARRLLLQKITLNANAANVTFSNIPQTFTDLRIVVSARSNAASTDSVDLYAQMNGATTNYSMRRLFGSGSTASSDTASGAATSLRVGNMPGANPTANSFGSTTITIPNYTGSATKPVLSESCNENNGSTALIMLTASLWSDTAAITQILLAPFSGSFIAGSTFYLYGLAQVPVIVGGTETISGGYKIHTFTATSSLRVVEAGQVEYLVVAGGGSGGGQYEGGGGGAGGILRGVAALSVGNQSITIGGGGAAAAGGTDGGTNGTDTSAFSLTATGGGRGGRFSSGAGASGGSGGGGGGPGGGGGSAVSGQGNAGGSGGSGAGGGGGGAGASGGNASTNTGGAGGTGILWNGVFYGGGGGGGATTTIGPGGNGGGGSGANYTVGAQAGAANRGGGGGGIRESVGVTAGAGGSGIVIIRYPVHQ